MALTESLGVRVVRGPDWPSSSNEDGGEGFVGTVVEKATGDAAGGDVAEAASALQAEGGRLVVVQWDVGTRGSYLCGEQGKYDLRILDVAPASFHRSGVECSSCSTPLIHGLRWQCLDCKGYNLCSVCYTTDRHDSNHCFCFFTRDDSYKFDVAKRAGARLITSQGAFPGAEVCLLPFPDGRKDEADRAMGSVVEICSDDADRPVMFHSLPDMVNFKSSNLGQTLLHRATQAGALDTLELILDQPETNNSAVEILGRSVLVHAILKESRVIVNHLVRCGVRLQPAECDRMKELLESHFVQASSRTVHGTLFPRCMSAVRSAMAVPFTNDYPSASEDVVNSSPALQPQTPSTHPASDTSNVVVKTDDTYATTATETSETTASNCSVQTCSNVATVTFHPCGHTVTCRGCCFLFNICCRCWARVEKRMWGEVEVQCEMQDFAVRSQNSSRTVGRKSNDSIETAHLPEMLNDLNMVVGVHGCVPSSDERSCIADIPD